jgi:hypothetical protein
MSTRIALASTISRPARLAACLATALGLTLSAAQASDAPAARMPLAEGRMAPAFERPSYLHGNATRPHAALVHASSPSGPTPHSVTKCNDDGTPGTLRFEVANANNHDVIDLKALACSTITLGGTAIEVDQDYLYLQGPIAGPSHLTIDGGHQSAVFNHFGAGTLGFSDLTIANGYYVSSVEPFGGCIYSVASVYLLGSVVSHCTVESSSSSIPALGAGVYAAGNLRLFESTITESHAFALNGANSFGGGVFAKGYLQALYSTISNSSATAVGGGVGLGGGAYASGNVAFESSTISGNHAALAGGLDFFPVGGHTAAIINSTISSNTATVGYGGIWTFGPLTLTSSTVAFNRSASGNFQGAGVYSEAPLTLHSSIIADNSGPNGPNDLGGSPGAVITNGSGNNLITSSTLNVPLGTIIACPKLEPLADNGGSTRTHRLKPTSPAIDQGDPGILSTDQRGAPRVAGIAADIGSVEGQPGEPPDEHIFVSGFDGVCDQ